MRRTRRWATLACWTAAALIAAGCGSGPGKARAAAEASSMLANPVYSAQASNLENQLLANLQAEFKARPGHPYADGKAAIKDTFPAGDASAIIQHGVQTFTLAVFHSKGPGSARQKWVAGVVSFALAQGKNASGPPRSPPATPAASLPATATPAGSGT